VQGYYLCTVLEQFTLIVNCIVKLSFRVGYHYFSSQQHHCVSSLKIIRILHYRWIEFIIINSDFLFYVVMGMGLISISAGYRGMR